MSNELTLKAISTYNGNLHNGLTTALEAVVSMVLEEAAKVAEVNEPEPSKEEMDDSYDDVAAYRVGRWEAAGDIATAIRALKEGE